jgi:hypothetical protein
MKRNKKALLAWAKKFLKLKMKKKIVNKAAVMKYFDEETYETKTYLI